MPSLINSVFSVRIFAAAVVVHTFSSLQLIPSSCLPYLPPSTLGRQSIITAFSNSFEAFLLSVHYEIFSPYFCSSTL